MLQPNRYSIPGLWLAFHYWPGADWREAKRPQKPRKLTICLFAWRYARGCVMVRDLIRRERAIVDGDVAEFAFEA